MPADISSCIPPHSSSILHASRQSQLIAQDPQLNDGCGILQSDVVDYVDPTTDVFTTLIGVDKFDTDAIDKCVEEVLDACEGEFELLWRIAETEPNADHQEHETYFPIDAIFNQIHGVTKGYIGKAERHRTSQVMFKRNNVPPSNVPGDQLKNLKPDFCITEAPRSHEDTSKLHNALDRQLPYLVMEVIRTDLEKCSQGLKAFEASIPQPMEDLVHLS